MRRAWALRGAQALSAVVLGACATTCACRPTPAAPANCFSLASLGSGDSLRLERAFPNIDIPEALVLRRAPSAEGRWYLATQSGVIYHFVDDPEAQAEVFADISAKVAEDSEAGLLGLAFHPDYETNSYIYLSYTTPGGGAFTTRISRFTAASDTQLELDSETIIFELSQPYVNHNGGDLHFGPDGMLYLGLGDGGSAKDPQGNGQNTDNLLGAMLRFDVDGGTPYAIPADNPFAAGGGAPEIFAWGLRNPWRFSFDMETGELWAGDVGQYEWEEVDRIRLGGNYGWAIKEGDHCFGEGVTECDESGLVDPIVEYANPDDASVVGGYVYRGEDMPSLRGSYIYTDFYFGTIWGVVEGSEAQVLIGNSGHNIGAFAQDHDGELYLLEYGGGIYSLRPNDDSGAGEMPMQLSKTGCVDGDDPKRPSETALSYEVAHAFWSDGAVKERWLHLPEDQQIEVLEDGQWRLPIGSVVTKMFRLDDRVVETRLLIHHVDGRWAGYSYRWNDAERDAILISQSETATYGESSWTFPSRADCLGCHTSAANYALGLETVQMAVSDQLEVWGAASRFDTLPQGEALLAVDGEGTLDARARSYLHANCAQCHRPGGRSNTPPNFLVSTTAAELGVCDVLPVAGDLGITDARLLVPGDPERSLVLARMKATDETRMPNIASHLVDDAGVALIEAWIAEMLSCS